MEKSISATEANRKFSQMLREVRQGQSFVVTSHGKAVAKIEPVRTEVRSALRARTILLRRLRTNRVVRIGRWAREELYENKQ